MCRDTSKKQIFLYVYERNNSAKSQINGFQRAKPAFQKRHAETFQNY